MFRGINTVSLDDKGRLAIPARCREVLDISNSHGQLIVTIDTEERCLLMYPLIFWEDIEKQMIISVLEECGNNVTRAAKQLGLSRKGLQLKMMKYKLRRSE